MILTLFLALVGISVILIIIGLLKPSHSEQAIIGFFFLFLLSFTIMNGTLEIPSGENSSIDYTYEQHVFPPNEDLHLINNTKETTVYSYENYQSHQMGFWFIVASAVGMIGVIVSLRGTYKDDE